MAFTDLCLSLREQTVLTGDEKRTILNALSIARLFYEKTKRKEEYFQVEDLFELLFFEKEITVSLSEQDATCYSEDAKRLDTILKEKGSPGKCPGRRLPGLPV